MSSDERWRVTATGVPYLTTYSHSDDVIERILDVIYYMECQKRGTGWYTRRTAWNDARRAVASAHRERRCACCERTSAITLDDEQRVCCALCAATDGEQHDLRCQLRFIVEAHRSGRLTPELLARVKEEAGWALLDLTFFDFELY